MLLKDISFSSPEKNILYDEVLLQLAEKGKMDEVLRLWESSVPFIVLGRISKIDEDLKLSSIKKDRIPVLRRFSGGGTVLQGKGCLNYSFVLSKEKNPLLYDIRRSYQFICENVISVLKDVGIDAVFKPTSDLAIREGEKKFSGNAQRRLKKYILHHGTILYDFDLSLINRYLKMPKKVPQYRQGRPHEAFVTNIAANVGDIKEAFRRIFSIKGEGNHLSWEEEEELNLLLSSPRINTKIVSSI